jgi:CP family cyanate transporter-like MFS transporter
MLYGSGVLAGIAIGTMNVLLPGIVKRDFPRKVGAVTGFYTMMLCVGAAGAAALAPQVEILFAADWTLALAVWGLLALIAIPAWAPLRAHFHSAPQADITQTRNLWTSALAWQVTIYLGLASALAYSVFGWGAKILQDRGMDVPSSGLMLGLSILVQGAGAQVAPLMASRKGDLRLSALAMMAFGLAGLLGYLFAPIGSMWLWSVLLGIGQGGAFAIALTMIAQRGGTPQMAARLSGMTQSVGYMMGALTGPLAVGLVHDFFGGWPPVAILFTAITLGASVCALGAGRVRTV